MKDKMLLILANLFWAGNYIFGKYVVSEISPTWITFIRWSLALLLLLPLSYWLEKPNYRYILKTSTVSLVGLGLLGVIGYNLFLYGALEYTSPVNASLVNTINPAMIILFSLLLLKERISLVQIVGFIVSLIGVLFILTNGHLIYIFETHFNKGDLLMIAAILVWTLYSILGKKIPVPPITATALSVLFSVIILLPFVIMHPINITQLSQRAIMGIIYMWIFPSVCSFVFWNTAVRKVGANQAAIYLNLLTVFTALISVIMGDPLTFSQLFGGVLVIIGVILTTRTSLEIHKRKPIIEKSI
jgi:drug/metabolite transporter (DMT)-like permease